jgi:hypothetical protein
MQRILHHPTSIRRGLGRADVLVALTCVVVATAALLPLLGAVGSQSGEARSHANLRTLAMANEAYAATFDQRQPTYIPEDAGTVNGNCQTYIAVHGCPPPVILGSSPSGATWGYYLGAPCVVAGNCGNWVAYKAFTFAGADSGFGAFRLPNVRAFNPFVDGRFYSDTFYAPNDTGIMRISAPYRDAGLDFDYANSAYALSSYCFSPAAMLNPTTLGSTGFVEPNTYVEGFTSPAVTACTYPDLKTRMIEHNWNHGQPSAANVNFAGASEPWYFNASPAASTQSIFFDGHIGRIVTGDAIADDLAATRASGHGLWHRGTPLGANGYYGAQGIDSARNSHTILTIDGILGRDVLTAR